MFEDIIGTGSVGSRLKPGRRIKLLDRFHKTIDTMLRLNLENRQRLSSNVMTMPAFAFEYCTVKINVGRQTGKTEYIRRYATKHDAIIVSQEKQKKILFPNGTKADLFSARELKSEFETASISNHTSRDFPEYFNIYLDEPSYIFQTVDINKFYQEFTKSDTQTFIWLGI